jgi:peroxiredoxin
VDSDGSIADVYGVKKIPFLGLLKRQSVLIGPNGKVVRFYADVNPKSHATEVLKDLQELQKTAPQP